MPIGKKPFGKRKPLGMLGRTPGGLQHIISHRKQHPKSRVAAARKEINRRIEPVD